MHGSRRRRQETNAVGQVARRQPPRAYRVPAGRYSARMRNGSRADSRQPRRRGDRTPGVQANRTALGAQRCRTESRRRVEPRRESQLSVSRKSPATSSSSIWRPASRMASASPRVPARRGRRPGQRRGVRVRGDGAQIGVAVELPWLDGQPPVQEVADREPAPVEVAVMAQPDAGGGERAQQHHRRGAAAGRWCRRSAGSVPRACRAASATTEGFSTDEHRVNAVPLRRGAHELAEREPQRLAARAGGREHPAGRGRVAGEPEREHGARQLVAEHADGRPRLAPRLGGGLVGRRRREPGERAGGAERERPER